MNILEIIAHGDIVGPVTTVIGGLVHGGGYTFHIQDGNGMTGNQIKRGLRSKGITVISMYATGQWFGPTDILALTVPKSQEEKATAVLAAMGITEAGEATAQPTMQAQRTTQEVQTADPFSVFDW